MIKNQASILLMIALFPLLAFAQEQDQGMVSSEVPREFQGIGIDEKLGAQLDLSLMVKDETGASIPLRTFFTGDKPVSMSLVYFNCPGLCNFHLNGLTEAMKKIDWSAGQKFEVLALSFDPKETSEMAAKKKANYMKVYGRPGTEGGWHFLTADEATIKKIAETTGFKYRWDEKNKEWAHASAATIMSPEGKITHYLHGIIFEPKDVKLALMDAVGGKTGSIADRLIWFCYHYDASKSKYSIMASRLMQVGGGLCILILAAFLIPFWIRSRKESA
jgi:protein SCO1/2